MDIRHMKNDYISKADWNKCSEHLPSLRAKQQPMGSNPPKLHMASCKAKKMAFEQVLIQRWPRPTCWELQFNPSEESQMQKEASYILIFVPSDSHKLRFILRK